MDKDIRDKELTNVTGGTDIDTRKDLYGQLAELTEAEAAYVTGGDYITFEDSDDYVHQKTYEYAYRFSADPGQDVDKLLG